MTEIVKVQKPLASNDSKVMGTALVYAKGRKCMVQQWLDAATDTAMGADMKAFFEAELRPTGHWSIGKRVADQNW